VCFKNLYIRASPFNPNNDPDYLDRNYGYCDVATVLIYVTGTEYNVCDECAKKYAPDLIPLRDSALALLESDATLTPEKAIAMVLSDLTAVYYT